MKRHLIAAAAALSLGTVPAVAQESDAALGLGLSTLGPTLEGSFRINDRLGARGLWAGFNRSGSEDLDGVSYDADVTLGGVGLLLDYYPGDSGLRLSGGAFMSNTEFSGTATATIADPITVGGVQYNGGETLTTSVEFARRTSPMVTLGYDQDLGSHWTLTGEIGAIFTDGFDIDASGTGVAQADIDNEISEIEGELNELNIYPYLSLRMSLQF